MNNSKGYKMSIKSLTLLSVLASVAVSGNCFAMVDPTELFEASIRKPLFTVTNSTGKPLSDVSMTIYYRTNSSVGRYNKTLTLGELAEGSSKSVVWKDLGYEFSSLQDMFLEGVSVDKASLVCTSSDNIQFNLALTESDSDVFTIIQDEPCKFKLKPAQ